VNVSRKKGDPVVADRDEQGAAFHKVLSAFVICDRNRRRLGQFSALREISTKGAFEMSITKFDRPVAVFVGLGFPSEVETVMDAYAMLVEWNGIPDLDRAGAIEVCRKALKGKRTGREARLAFQRFALRKGILSEDGPVGRPASRRMPGRFAAGHRAGM
jgi:hypothetical protein